MKRHMILFRKADMPAGGGGIANRPGLTQKIITHSDGKQVKHWVREGDAAAFGPQNVHHGDKVHYPGGSGEVVARGEHGATIKPDGGDNHHQVGWHDMHSIEAEKQQEEAPNAAPSAAPEEGKNPQQEQAADDRPPGIFGGKNLFSSEELSAPRVYAQPNINSFETLKEHGGGAHQQYRDWLDEGKGFAVENGLELYDGDKDGSAFGRAMKDIEGGKEGPLLLLAPVKGGKRLQEKVSQDLEGDWAKVTDFVRGTVAVDSLDQVPEMMEKLRASGVQMAKKPKDRFSNPLPAGYRDTLMVVKLPNGHAAELQLHVKAMLPAKDVAHKIYESERTMIGKAEAEKRPFTETEMNRIRLMRRRQQKIYQDAWRKASGEKEKRGHKRSDEQGLIEHNEKFSKGLRHPISSAILAFGKKAARGAGKMATEYFEKDGIPYRRDGLQRPEKYRGNGQWAPYYDLWTFDHGADPIEHGEAVELMQHLDERWKKLGLGAYKG